MSLGVFRGRFISSVRELRSGATSTIIQSIIGGVVGFVFGQIASCNVLMATAFGILAFLSSISVWLGNHILESIQRQAAVMRPYDDKRLVVHKTAENLISSARRSIIAITYHIEGPDPDSDKLEVYYRLFEDVIKRRGDGFCYERIVQLPESTKKISPDNVGLSAYKHFERVHNEWSNRAVPRGIVRQINADHPWSLRSSLLLIDDRDIIIDLPQKHPKDGVMVTTIVHLSENSGPIVDRIRDLVEGIRRNSIPARFSN